MSRTDGCVYLRIFCLLYAVQRKCGAECVNQLFKKQFHHNTYNWKILVNLECVFVCVCVYIYIYIYLRAYVQYPSSSGGGPSSSSSNSSSSSSSNSRFTDVTPAVAICTHVRTISPKCYLQSEKHTV